MTSEQRRALREALIAQGFERVHYTHDTGDGRYAEMWGEPSRENAIVISWGVRT